MVIALLKNRAVIGEWQALIRTRKNEEGHCRCYAIFVIVWSIFATYKPSLLSKAPHFAPRVRPTAACLSHIESQIAKKRDAHHEREIELDDLTGDERRTSRQRMRELLAEIGQLATERDHLARAIREADGLRREDFDERVRAGIARLTATDRVERRDARCRLNALLKERVEI